MITEPCCGINSDNDPEAISILISYDSLSQAQETLDSIIPGENKVLELIVSRSQSGEPTMWVKISESKVKCVWLAEV